tara:strand:+ start:1780 stop:2025 length:246 start_codon:yes stop_codon:yes gene_type:complete
MIIKFYTTDWCGDCARSKALLNKLNINFDEINVDTNSDANEYITKLQNNQRRIPTIVFEDGTYLVEPTDPELLEKINSYQN